MKQNLLIQEAKLDFTNAIYAKLSDSSKDFIKSLLQVDPAKRSKASQALEHAWIKVH